MGWEDVDAPAGAAPPGSQPQQQEAEHWRARAAQRQRYWSLSHGFKLGSKLGDWSKADHDAADAAEAAEAAATAGGRADEGEAAAAEAADEGGGSARKRGLLGACVCWGWRVGEGCTSLLTWLLRRLYRLRPKPVPSAPSAPRSPWQQPTPALCQRGARGRGCAAAGGDPTQPGRGLSRDQQRRRRHAGPPSSSSSRSRRPCHPEQQP